MKASPLPILLSNSVRHGAERTDCRKVWAPIARISSITGSFPHGLTASKDKTQGHSTQRNTLTRLRALAPPPRLGF